jgi:hypothetical protein
MSAPVSAAEESAASLTDSAILARVVAEEHFALKEQQVDDDDDVFDDAPEGQDDDDDDDDDDNDNSIGDDSKRRRPSRRRRGFHNGVNDENSFEAAAEEVGSEGDEAPFATMDSAMFDVSAHSVFEAFAEAWYRRQSGRGPADGAAAGGATLKRVRSFENLIPGPIKNAAAGVRDRINKRRADIEQRLKNPPFLRLIDMASFVFNVCLIPLTQYFILVYPQNFYILYTAIIIPLLMQRYMHYHALKYHYFLLDFCYFCQLILLYYCYFRPDSTLFQMLFLLCNGPLCWAIVMWKNSIVFHDWDKMFSFIIHYHPALVTYTIRWYRPEGLVPTHSISAYTLAGALVLYCFWQLIYLVKTEVLDKKKLNSDDQLMTSLRWLAYKKPHPIYRAIRKAGYNPDPVALLVVFQFFYSALIALPMFVAYHWRAFHEVYLMLVFVVAVLNGAQFYFEVFTESYTKRLAEAAAGPGKPNTHLTSLYSLTIFALFFAVAAPSLYFTIELAIHIAGGIALV